MKAKKILSGILALSLFCIGINVNAAGQTVNLDRYLDKGVGTYAVGMVDNRPFNGAYVVNKDGKVCFRGEFIKPVSGRSGSINTGIQIFNAGKDLNATKKGIVKVKANVMHEGDKTGSECFATSLGFLNADGSKETAYYGGRIYTNKISTQSNKDIKDENGNYYTLADGWNSVVFEVNTEKAFEKVYLNDEIICPQTPVDADISGGCKVWYWAFFGGPKDDSSFYIADYEFVNYDCEDDVEIAVDEAKKEMSQCSINVARDVVDEYASEEKKQEYNDILDELQDMLNSSAQLASATISYGTLEPAFSKEVTDYVITVPYGSTSIPSINVKPVSSMSKIDVNEAKSFDDDTVITVTSKDGKTSITYTIEFVVEKNNDAAIKEILADDCTFSPSFTSEVKEYFINVPYGTTTSPKLNIQMNDSNAKYDVKYPEGIGDIVINTVAEDEKSKECYTLHMNIMPAFLVENIAISGSESAIVNCDISKNKNFTDSYDVYTALSKRIGDDIIPLACDIKHIDTNAVENSKHSVEFEGVEYSKDLVANIIIDTTKDIKDSGKISIGFDNGVVEHNKVLTVTASNLNSKSVQLRIADNNGKVCYAEEIDTNENSITKAYIMPEDSIWADGKYTICVIEANEYATEEFELRPFSSDTSLKSVTTEYGDAILSEDKNVYTILVPYGIETVPEIKIEKSDKNSEYELTPATAVPGEGSINVIAEDKTEKKYGLIYGWNTNCAYLKELSLIGASLSSVFERTKLNYDSKLSSGTNSVPTVHALSVDPEANVKIDYPSSANGTIVITVTSKDGTAKNIYRISLSVKSSGSSGGGGGYSGSNSPVVPNIINNSIDGAPISNQNEDNTKSFVDIEEHWAKNDIIQMKNKGYVKGKDDERFYPDDNITRAEFCEIIVKSMGLEKKDDSISFEDVTEDKWYFNSVDIAQSLKIVSGYQNLFMPNNNITREEMACIIYRTYLLGNAPINEAESNFDDFAEISQWAGEGVSAMAELGIINGKGDNRFEPKANATRAEAVVIINRLLEKIK